MANAAGGWIVFGVKDKATGLLLVIERWDSARRRADYVVSGVCPVAN
jgi:hypothetical protein